MAQIRELDIDCAILQSRSPTCGVNQVYDGSFSGQLDSEYRMLSRLHGRGCCKVYGYDKERCMLFSDWWHTDQIISYVADLDFDVALGYAKNYIQSEDPFIRRWGYVLFISRLRKGHAAQLLPLNYYVQMAQGWLIAELAVHEPETVYEWFQKNKLKYNINGKAIQKICDSFRISDEWKAECKKLRPILRERK